jgi:sugar lactone lactonase YvrE
MNGIFKAFGFAVCSNKLGLIPCQILPRLVAVLWAAIILFTSGLLHAQLINVDFNNDSGGATHGGPSVGPNMSGAAVLGTAGDQWNGITTTNGSGISLIYANGSASTVKLSFTSGGGYDAIAYSGSTPFAGTPYNALMEDYLFNGSVPRTITLSGLASNAAYNLMLYNAADNGSGAAGRTTIFTVNGFTQSSTWDAASSAFIPGVDYVNYPSAVSDASGNLVITYNGSPEGDINGFQILGPIPVVTVTSPVNNSIFAAPANVNIAASATVAGGTVTNVQFFTNGASLGTDLTPPFVITASNMTAGFYALTAVATAGGNSVTSSAVNISVITPPQTNYAAAYAWTTLAGRAPTGSTDGVGDAVQFNGTAGVAVDPGGNIYVTDSGNNTIRKITAGGTSSTIAGFPQNSGTNDGVNGAARFFNPNGISVDSQTNLFVADTHNNRIRKITPVGTNWVVTTIAGTGSIYAGNCDSCPSSGGYVDGSGTSAQFNQPQGIAVDNAGNVYVADYANNTIRKLTPAGTNWFVSTIATNAQLSGPYGVGVDSASNVYVADTFHEQIRKLTPSGTNWVVSTLAGTGTLGTNDGPGATAKFFKPVGITVDGAGNVYVTDQVNDTIRKITSGGVVSTLAGAAQVPGTANGTGSAARFSSPFGIAVNSVGTLLYVADSQQIRKITSGGVVTTLAGSAGSAGNSDGTGSAARFYSPAGLSVDSAGNVYVADAGNHIIRQISSAGQVATIAGMAAVSGTNDGVGGNARFSSPRGVVSTSDGGTLYIADTGNNTIRTMTSDGTVTTVIGNAAVAHGSADGAGSSARFYMPGGIAATAGLYVADTDNNAIRRITKFSRYVPATGLFVTTWSATTLAGSAANPLGSLDGTNGSAQFDNPAAIAVDPQGNIYVADTYSQTIRKITPVGTNWVVTTIAGQAGGSGSSDGLGTSAHFFVPSSIAIDGAGNLYVADQLNSTIRKLTYIGTNWMVSTIGGLPGSYANQDGTGRAALFNQPDGIAVDSAGNVYVSDSWNNTIRKGVFISYGVANQVAYSAPLMNSSLQVTLTPANAAGQWRFPWEIGWRNSGQTASNLVAGNYTIQFRNVPGWLPFPSSQTVGVTNNISLTNQYYPTLLSVDTNSGGTLKVTLGPSPPIGAGWRFLGDTTSFYASGYSTNLLAGTYLIEFAGVAGYSKPPNLSVQVQAGQTMLLAENYLLASGAPASALLPFPVPVNNITNAVNYPFGFNGQLQSDVGYGSGVVVQTNVVLTAGHLVFNDQTLSYVSQAYWYFQREAGVFEPEPQSARGWYVLSGYAAQRTADVLTNGYAPDQSSPNSRNYDVAALYFLSPAAGGGYGGYLPSDASPNPWLAGNNLKMLVGYPVDGSQFGFTNIVPGQMYQTDPQPFPLSLVTDPVNGQQEVYLAAAPPLFLSYPGNSGGPVYVQFNGYYYPAGVYLGTLFQGSQYASLVRAIDSSVANLITNAAALGDAGAGTNYSGGGVITIIPNQAINAANPGYLQFTLSPPAAVAAGAGWRLTGDAAYSSATNYTRAVLTTNAFGVEFKPIAGWNVPANQTITIIPNQITTYTANYTLASITPTNPVLVANISGLGITGTTGTVYRLERRNSLTSGSWSPVSTNTITTSGFNLLLSNPATNGSVNFYRAVWLP